MAYLNDQKNPWRRRRGFVAGVPRLPPVVVENGTGGDAPYSEVVQRAYHGAWEMPITANYLGPTVYLRQDLPASEYHSVAHSEQLKGEPPTSDGNIPVTYNSALALPLPLPLPTVPLATASANMPVTEAASLSKRTQTIILLILAALVLATLVALFRS